MEFLSMHFSRLAALDTCGVSAFFGRVGQTFGVMQTLLLGAVPSTTPKYSSWRLNGFWLSGVFSVEWNSFSESEA